MIPTPEAVALLAQELRDRLPIIRVMQPPLFALGYAHAVDEMERLVPPPLAADLLAAALELGVAWQAAVDALPDGWWLSGVDQVYPARPEWTATAYSRDDHRRAEGPIPADALRALTAKLLAAKP